MMPIIRWLRRPRSGRPRWYLAIPEPRMVRGFYAVIYVALLTAGFGVLWHAPTTVEGEIGGALTLVWGLFLAIGSAIGLLAVLTPYWWVERLGILLATTGAGVYFLVVLSLQFVAAGNRVVQLSFIAVAILTLLLRWFRIRGALIEPGR